MENEEENKPKKTKVKDLILALKADELILNLPSAGKNDLAKFIKQFSSVLKPYGHLDGEEFLALLENFLKTCLPMSTKIESAFLSDAKVKSLSFDEIRNMISSNNLPTKDLLLIAEKNLGLPIGTLKKAKREIIKQRILGTIGNIEKLDTIGKKAAE